MAPRKGRMCRLCLSTTAILRSIFTIFRNYNLVFIIRDLVKLEIKEDDKLPKSICKSCAVKLIRMRDNATLFIDSDRKLRDKLAEVDGAEVSWDDAVNELGQTRKRKYTKRADNDDDSLDGGGAEVDREESDDDKTERLVKKELVECDGPDKKTGGNHLIEFSNVKEEIVDSDEDDDLPLKILSISVGSEVLDGVVKHEVKPAIAADGCKKEVNPPESSFSPTPLDKVEADDKNDESDFDDPVALSPMQTDDDSDYEAPQKRTRATRNSKKPVPETQPKAKRAYRRRVKVESDIELSDVEEDGDDEEKDKTFEIDVEIKRRSKSDEIEGSDDEVKVKKKRGRKKGTKLVKDPNKPVQKRKAGGRPRKLPIITGPVPTMHDYKCYICNSESLGCKKALLEHFSTHVDKIPFTCKECVMETVVINRVRGLNSHMKMHAQPVKCDYCDRRYSNSAGKYYHTQVFHLGLGAPCQVECEICGKTCGSQNALKSHMKYHTTKLKCSKCDMVFNHPNKRRNHERLHDENRGMECVICKKVLQSLESYDVHLKKHSQERSFQCNLCSKKFATSCNLITHLKVHAKNDNYRPAKSWIEHYTVLSRDPMHFKCNHCDRYNTDKVNNMISHLQAHFKEYECDQCKHKFATAKQLRAHYTTHTGDKPEKCKYCEKVFSTKNNLRIHLKASHPEWVPQRQQAPTVTVTQPQGANPAAIPATVVTMVPTAEPEPLPPATTPNSDIFDATSSNSGFGMINQQHVQLQQRTQMLPHQPVANLNILRS